MSLRTKQIVIFVLGLVFLASLIFVQWTEVVRREQEAGLRGPHIVVPTSSQGCVQCHQQSSPGIIDHWRGSTHAVKGVGCVECHLANPDDVDAFDHYGSTIATIVLVFVTRAALKERQYAAVMAATGLMYLAILTAFGQDVVARILLDR